MWRGETSVACFWGLAAFVRQGLLGIGQDQGLVHKDYGPDGYGDHPRSRVAHGVRDLAGELDTPERLVQAHWSAKVARQLA